jgi:antitoxin (DNA-binding transcriptional repressor) of toxin-antitoxin stability system
MSKTIDIKELPTKLDEVLRLTAAGDEVLLVDGATPRAKVVPIRKTAPRVPGLHVGGMSMAPDFKDPLPEGFWAGQK